MTQHS